MRGGLNPANYEDRERLLELDTTGNDRSWMPTVDELAAEEDRERKEKELHDAEVREGSRTC